jgi:hypothetical protein
VGRVVLTGCWTVVAARNVLPERSGADLHFQYAALEGLRQKVHSPLLAALSTVERRCRSVRAAMVFLRRTARAPQSSDYLLPLEYGAVVYVAIAFTPGVMAGSKAARLASGLDDRYASQLLEALAVVQRQQQYQERIAVPVNGRVLLVDTKDIHWIEAERNCVRLHVGKLIYELRNTLSNLESKLNPKQFARIHRSTLVNISKVKEIHPWFHGHHKVILLDGCELRMSRYQSESVKLLLGNLNQ